MLRLSLAVLTFTAALNAGEQGSANPQPKSCVVQTGDGSGERNIVGLDKIYDTYWSDSKLDGNRLAFDPSSSSVMLRSGQGARQDAIVTFYYYRYEEAGDEFTMLKYRVGRNEHCSVKVQQPSVNPNFKIMIADPPAK